MTEAFLEKLKQTKVNWQRTPEDPYLFFVEFEGQPVQLRLNDFPDEPLCTVICQDSQVDLHEFPSSWKLPGQLKV